MLLAARDEEGDGGGMTDRQLRDEVMTLFLAGHETTASALTWTFYLLSLNPEAEARLLAEVDAVVGDRPPTVDDLPRLRFTEGVFAESLRLYPPAWGIDFRALHDVAIGPYRIEKDAYVATLQWVVHRDPRFWPDPTRFDPDRWTPEARAARPKFAYFPFGAGARQCIAEPFAWMEGSLVLATIAQRWRLRLRPGQTVDPQPLITLRPRQSLEMSVESRAPATRRPEAPAVAPESSEGRSGSPSRDDSPCSSLFAPHPAPVWGRRGRPFSRTAQKPRRRYPSSGLDDRPRLALRQIQQPRAHVEAPPPSGWSGRAPSAPRAHPRTRALCQVDADRGIGGVAVGSWRCGRGPRSQLRRLRRLAAETA
jgi:hypothetical protein